MQFIPPYPEVQGDSPTRIMAASSGQIVGLTRSRAVWRYGALIGSPLADGLKWHTERFTWILATRSGRILATYYGFPIPEVGLDGYTLVTPGLPERFKKILRQALR